MVGDTTELSLETKIFLSFFSSTKKGCGVGIFKKHLFDTKNRESFNEKLAYSCSKCHLTINNKWFI